jgi:O-antigen ligase
MVVAATLIGLSVAVISFFPVTRERIQDIFNSNWTGILRNDYTLNASTYTGLTLRVSFWKIAIKRMYEDKILFFGVGTGDATDYMNEAYREYGLLDAGFLDYNLHNAFLEVLLEFGFAGLAYYLLLLACMIRFAILKRDQILFLTLAIIISFGMTESVLNVNKGIAFFFFFFSFLMSTHVIPPQPKIPRS